ncbi:tyrosine kinase receptor Cad96Ca [Narcine bancroftii]|uniref:tyrosine kinase receptor Cad96Ca n=1 Tax=Narcine bancroftii TaxID=1343680 RepID=UPI00383108AE
MVRVLPSLHQSVRQHGHTSKLPGTQLPARMPSMQDLSLVDVLKIGQHGCFYIAKVTRGHCKGYRLVTCKLTMKTMPQKILQSEIKIMKKLGYHRNVVQLLEWNVLEEPYILIMEHVGRHNLKSFLQSNRSQLSGCRELQSKLTSAGYFISLGMEHIASRKIVHRDLAARNILVGRFPQECKIAEFSMAVDISVSGAKKQMRGSRNSCIPFRWYPPEYFTDGIYDLQGDVWAFGILLWELHSLGTSPYPGFETAKEVVINICSGYKMAAPLMCRREMYEVMEFCWTSRSEERPVFSDIARYLEDVVENDADYVKIEDCFEPNVPLGCSPPWSQSIPCQEETYMRDWMVRVNCPRGDAPRVGGSLTSLL